MVSTSLKKKSRTLVLIKLKSKTKTLKAPYKGAFNVLLRYRTN